jgi:predicted hotdog family 3-hydroxylacyl-ACP dehydratase
MNPARFRIEELLPHDFPMILLKELVSIDSASVTSSVIVSSDCILLDNKQELPPAVGIEWMAQTVAAHAGYLALANNKQVKIGYLLGTRKYRNYKKTYKSGEQFTITANEVFRGNGMGVFSCSVFQNESVVAEATINTFQPDSNDSVLEPTGATSE